MLPLTCILICLSALDLESLPSWLSMALTNATLSQRSGHIGAAIESLRQIRRQLGEGSYEITSHGLDAEMSLQLAIWLYKAGGPTEALSILREQRMQNFVASDTMAQLVLGAATDSVAQNGRASTKIYQKAMALAKQQHTPLSAFVASSSKPYARAIRTARGCLIGPVWDEVRTGQDTQKRHCDIERRHSSSLTRQQFAQHYVRRGKPVIITSNGGSKASGWKGWEGWYGQGSQNTKMGGMSTPLETLLKSAGNATIRVTPSRIVHTLQSHPGDFAPAHAGLADFAQKVVQGHRSDDEAYLVQELQLIAPQMARHSPDPALFEGGGTFTWTAEQRQSRRLLMLGAAGSSSYFHSHSNTYNILLEGTKHWYLMPPLSYFGPMEGMSMAEWAEELREWEAAGSPGPLSNTTGPQRRVAPDVTPLRCTQVAGELLFVPSHWQHGVVNAAESQYALAVATEVGADRTRNHKRRRRRAEL
jgi:hypothetical protein